MIPIVKMQKHRDQELLVYISAGIDNKNSRPLAVLLESEHSPHNKSESEPISILFSTPHVSPLCPELSLKASVGCREMRLSGSERTHGVRKKAGRLQEEEGELSLQLLSTVNVWDLCGPAPWKAHYGRIQWLIQSHFCRFLIFMAAMYPNIKRKHWVLFTSCLRLLIVPGLPATNACTDSAAVRSQSQVPANRASSDSELSVPFPYT